MLDIPIRKFVNIRNKLNHQSLWALNSNIRNLIVTDSQNYDMKSMWATLKKYRGRNNISFKHNNHHVFQIKLINHLLPTRANMRVLFPSIYSDNMCKLCNAEKETINHLTICDYFKDSWIAIKRELLNYIEEQINKLWDININTKIIRSLFDSCNDLITYNKIIIAWLLGIIPTSYMNFLSKLLKLKGKARKIANLTDKVQKIFKDNIWVIRCNKLKELNLLHCNLMELYKNNSKNKNGAKSFGSSE